MGAEPSCDAKGLQGVCGATDDLVARRGACVHEHVKVGWACARHRSMTLICAQCAFNVEASHSCEVAFTAIPAYECAYSRCERVFLTKPHRRPDEVKWLGVDGAATYCDSLCADAETDARVELRPVIV